MKSKDATKRILQILVSRNSDDLFRLLGTVDDITMLDRDLREKIALELGRELTSKGLNTDDEPNAYGLEIESLIDACKVSAEK
jgi:hypothetical protein